MAKRYIQPFLLSLSARPLVSSCPVMAADVYPIWGTGEVDPGGRADVTRLHPPTGVTRLGQYHNRRPIPNHAKTYPMKLR